jgi:hypothetical protein
LENGEVQAKTAFLVYRSHLETDHQLLSGRREDVPRKGNGELEVARRTIVLDASVLLDKNLRAGAGGIRLLQPLALHQPRGSQRGDHERATSLLAPLPRQVFFTEIGAARGTAS